MEDKQNKIELKHEAIEELLGTPPGWLTRWGITVFFVVILALLTGCYFFKYPEIATAPIVITTEEPVSWIVSRTTGKIDSIFARDKAFVRKDQVIAVIYNAAETADVLKIKHILYRVRKEGANPDELFSHGSLQLGELQDAYFTTQKCMNDYKLFITEQVFSKRIKSTEYEIQEQSFYLSTLRQQAQLQTQNFKLICNQYKRDSTLFAKEMITQADYERAQQQYISGQILQSQSVQEISNTQAGMARLRQAVQDYESEYNNQLATLKMNLNGMIDQLVVAIELWEQSYLLRSPTDGKLSFSNYWSRNQTLIQGEKVFAVVPQFPGKIIGKCVLPTVGSGKVEVGQAVNIKLEGYPYMEFGMLQGRVGNIALAASETTTPDGIVRCNTVEVELTVPLVTTYKRKIEFAGEMTGVAEISLKEMSLLEHFISPLKYLWNKF